MKGKNMRWRMITAADRTWQAIGGDILAMEESGECDATLVREMVLDADRMRMYGEDKEAVDAFYALPRVSQDAVLREAFPAGRYC